MPNVSALSNRLGTWVVALAILLTMCTPLAARAAIAEGEYTCSTGLPASGVNTPSPTFTVISSGLTDGSRCDGQVVIPNGVQTIEISAFAHNRRITSVSVPPSVEWIKASAFTDTQAMATLTFNGESLLKTIDLSAFDNAISLAALDIPKSVERVAMNAFASTASLMGYNYCGQATFDQSSGLQSKSNSCQPYYDSSTGSGNFGCSVGSMSIQGFTVVANTDCRGRALVPPGVTAIGANAFSGAEGMSSVSLPISVTSVSFSFSQLTNLGHFTYCGAKTKSDLQMRDNQINQCPSPASGSGDGIVACSAGYFTIANHVVTANTECSGLASLPTGVTSISDDAFYNDAALTSIVIPQSVNAIGAHSLQGTSMTELVLPDAISGIEDSTFYGMQHLIQITIPANVTYIASRAFAGDSSLQSVTFGSNHTLQTIGSLAFFADSSLTYISIPSSVVSIETRAFFRTGLTSVEIPPLVTELTDYVFAESQLTSVVIPANVVSIGISSFEIASLANITFTNNSNLASVGDFAFAQSQITELNLPARVASFSQASAGSMNLLSAINVSQANPNFSSDSHGVMFDKGATRLLIYPPANPQVTYRLPDTLTVLDPYSIAFVPALLSFSYCSHVISDADLAIGLINTDEQPLQRVDCQIDSPPGSMSNPNQAAETRPFVTVNEISGQGETRTIHGTLLSGISKVTVNGMAVTILKCADEELQFEVPALAAGNYDISLTGLNGTLVWSSALTIKAPAAIAHPQLTETRTMAGFAGGSSALTVSQRILIKTFASGLRSVVCVGATANSKVTQADRTLALKRARAACAYVQLLNPAVSTEVKITPSVGLGSASRKVTFIVTKSH